MRIEIRMGKEDWAELFVDGEFRYGNHSIPDHKWIELLKELGAEIVEPEGDFDEDSGEWVPNA